MALNFFEIKDRISGNVYVHSNPKKNLLIKMQLPELKRNGEFEQIKHDLIQAGFNVFMPEKTNSYCFLQERGKFIPTPITYDRTRESIHTAVRKSHI